MENTQENSKSTLYKTEKVTFILPVCNSMPHIQATIGSLFESTTYPFKLIIVESESTDGTREYVDYLSTTNNNINVIHARKEGTIKAINMGVNATGDDEHIFLCHDDVFFFKWYKRDWLNDFMTVLINQPPVGILVPLSGGGVSGPDYIDRLSWAGTWSTLIRNDTVNKLGRKMLLDENFGKGYGEDIELSYRCIKEGYQIVYLSFWVDHHRMTEHINNEDIEVEKLKQKNAIYFRKKHKIGEFNETDSS